MSALAITTTIPSTETIWSVAFSQDGNTLALGITHKKPNETIILWNVKDWHKGVQPTPINPRALADHTESVRALAFSPDGKTLASGGDDDNIILWEINRENLEPLPEEPDQEDFDSWVKKACNIVGRNMTEAEIEQFKLEDILNEDNVTGPCPGSFPAPAMNLTSSSAPPLTDIAPPIPTLTETATPTETPTPTFTPMLSPTPIPSFTATQVPPLTATLPPTAEATLTLTPEPTFTPTPTASVTATSLPTPEPTFTPTPTPSPSATLSPTPSDTPTPTPTLKTEISP
jgi:hypothetical protein